MGEDLQADQRIHGRLALARLEVGRRSFGVVGLDEQAAARRLLGLLSELVEYRTACVEESTADPCPWRSLRTTRYSEKPQLVAGT